MTPERVTNVRPSAPDPLALPLARTCARLPQLDQRLQAFVQPSAAGTWFSPSGFFDEPRFTALRGLMEERYATPSRPAVAAKLLSRYQWGILVTAIGCYLRDARVPDLQADNLCLRWHEEDVYVDAVAYESGRFTALPGDPAAGEPGVRVVACRDTLRTRLRLEIESHFADVIDTLCDRISVNPRSLWPTVADRCAAALLWLAPPAARIGAFAGSVEHEVDALVNAPGSPLHNQVTGVFPVSCAGQTHLFLKRAACCHAYRREDREACDTCPRFTAAERADRLRARVIREANGTQETAS